MYRLRGLRSRLPGHGNFCPGRSPGQVETLHRDKRRVLSEITEEVMFGGFRSTRPWVDKFGEELFGSGAWELRSVIEKTGGADETRTRDLLRDRQAF